MKVEGLVTRKNIKRWLEQYNELKAGGRVEYEVSSGGGGPKNKDGVSGSQINMMMLDDAIAALRVDHEVLYNCIYFKFIHCYRWKQVQPLVNMARSTYYKYVDAGVDYLYYKINGETASMLSLLEAIKTGKSTISKASQQKSVLRR